MYSQMNCLIENEYIRQLSKKKKTSMYSEMNCLIENKYIRELPPPKKKTRMYSQMNCLIENDYIKGTFQKKHLCIPKWIA